MGKDQSEILNASGMQVLNWKTAQGIRPSDCEIVVLDTRIAARTEAALEYYEYFFENMRPEIEILLQASVLTAPSFPPSLQTWREASTVLRRLLLAILWVSS